MANSFEGTTLALQHYYDIGGISRKFPLMTLYQASEQPFGQRVSVWMSASAQDMRLSKETADRLDEALLKNRAIAEPHVLRVLDYGSSEGHSFVVTDYLEAPSLRAWLGAHGPLAPWQALRLLEQLTNVVISAHRAGLKDLCLTSENVFVVDEKRFEIATGPLGIGLFRSEVLALKDITISNSLVRHIPPWEYRRHVRPRVQSFPEPDVSLGKAGKTREKAAGSSAKGKAAVQSGADTPEMSEDIQDVSLSDVSIVDDVQDVSLSDVSIAEAGKQEDAHSDAGAAGDETAEAKQPEADLEVAPEGEAKGEGASPEEAVSAILKEEVYADSEARENKDSEPKEDVCSDIYGLAALIYEALCGLHPYFNEDSDLGDAALALMQAKPAWLAARVEIPEGLSDVVMEKLAHPTRDSAEKFLFDFAAQCTESDREMAARADKVWFEPAPTVSPGRKRRVTVPKMRHPRILLAALGILILAISIFVTYRVAQYSEPADLFAIPELVPAASDGVDVVIASRTVPPDTSVYMTSFADGSLIKLGGLPLIYRKQAQGAKLSFVIADEHGHSEQLPVTVKGENGLMMVYVEPKW